MAHLYCFRHLYVPLDDSGLFHLDHGPPEELTEYSYIAEQQIGAGQREHFSPLYHRRTQSRGG